MSSPDSDEIDEVSSRGSNALGPESNDSSFSPVIWVLILIAILGAGGALAWYLGTTGPTAQRDKDQSSTRAQRVSVTRVTKTDNPVRIEGYGSVEPARRIDLVPQVSGKVTDRSDSLHPGGFLNQGDTVLQIERDDYRLAVEQRRSELEQAESELKLTRSDQSVARDEYERISDQLEIENPSVVLKEPQVNSAKAAVRNARSALEKAKLNLERTSIEAPFNAHVTRRNIELGKNVSQGQKLATLVGTNEYWVKLSISASSLHWLHDDNGDLKEHLPVKIFNESAWSESTYRKAFVKDLIRELETKGRMAQILVAIDDPLALEPSRDGNPSMMVGSYVKGVIKAGTIPNSIKIDRNLIRGGDKVWVATSEGELDIHEVKVTFRGKTHAIVTDGLESGDRVIRTDLSSPVNGMSVLVTNGEQNARSSTTEKKPSESTKNSSRSVRQARSLATDL